ncbi:MAG TPA: hypothetical protein PLO37_22095 [Candidatus Hydrogenedentes bacterium]|nr:hypothetical protein [Candidatus Hydrogenedentota bacterium]
MISCTDFIWVYSELFKFLEARGGEAKVIEFWRGISDEFLTNLREYVAEDGLKGMFRYWSHTLGEEGGRHHMTLYDDMFVIDMHDCPSAKKIFRDGRVEPYPKYCEHCRWLYPPLLEEFGYEVDYHVLDCEKGACRLTVRKPPGVMTPDDKAQ